MLVKLDRGIFVFEVAGKTQPHRLCNSRLCHHVPQKTTRIIMFKLIREVIPSFLVSFEGVWCMGSGSEDTRK